MFRVTDVKFNQFTEVFSYKCNGDVIYRSNDGKYLNQKGDDIEKPDSVYYRVKAKIEDHVGNPLWCIIYDEVAEKLFGIPAQNLFEQIEKLEKEEPTKNWKQELVYKLNELEVDLIIRCNVTHYNSRLNGVDGVQKNWIVEQLKPIEIESE